MPTVNTNMRDLLAAYYLTSRMTSIDLRRKDVTRLVATVGESSLQNVLCWKPRDVDHNMAKARLVNSNLDYTGSNLKVHKRFSNLDRSEKAIVSYCLGMGLAKMMSEVVLGVAWMQHVDPLVDAGTIVVSGNTKVRPDLAGTDAAGRWHVLEAKGRSNGASLSVDDEETAKNQVEAVAEIDGCPPVTRSVSAAFLGTEPISVEFWDPDEEPPQPSYWEVNRVEFFKAYYASALGYLKHLGATELTVKAGDTEIKCRTANLNFASGKMLLGLPNSIAEKPDAAPAIVSGYGDDLKMALVTQYGPEKTSVGKDGVFVVDLEPPGE